MRQVGEPTVEEILDSIKKVIARDNRASAADERRGRAQHALSAAPGNVGEDDDADHDDVLDLADDEAIEEFAGNENAQDGGDAPLLADETRSSMRESLAALAMLSQPGAQPQIVRSGETSLEALTRELLRPALAQWLEQNLPPIVERMVASEIARMVGKRG